MTITASYLTYRPDLASSAIQEGPQDRRTPLGWDCLDAPNAIPSGCHQRVEAMSIPGFFMSLPGCVLREAL